MIRCLLTPFVSLFPPFHLPNTDIGTPGSSLLLLSQILLFYICLLALIKAKHHEHRTLNKRKDIPSIQSNIL